MVWDCDHKLLKRPFPPYLFNYMQSPYHPQQGADPDVPLLPFWAEPDPTLASHLMPPADSSNHSTRVPCASGELLRHQGRDLSGEEADGQGCPACLCGRERESQGTEAAASKPLPHFCTVTTLSRVWGIGIWDRWPSLWVS